MELTVVTKMGPEGKDLDVDDLVHKHLTQKLGKIEQRLGKPIVARAVLVELPEGFETTITLLGGHDLVGKAHGDLLLKAVDGAVDKLTRQFEAETEKRTGRERQRRGSGVTKAVEF